MEKIFQDAKDLHVVGTKVYAKTGDAFAYSDSEFKNKITVADLQEMYVKGMVIVAGDFTYKPVALKVASNVATVTYVTANTSTPTTAVLATLKSE